MRRTVTIAEQSFGTEHPNVAIGLNNLAQLLNATNRLAEAEPLMRRALAIDELWSDGDTQPFCGPDREPPPFGVTGCTPIRWRHPAF